MFQTPRVNCCNEKENKTLIQYFKKIIQISLTVPEFRKNPLFFRSLQTSFLKKLFSNQLLSLMKLKIHPFNLFTTTLSSTSSFLFFKIQSLNKIKIYKFFETTFSFQIFES